MTKRYLIDGEGVREWDINSFRQPIPAQAIEEHNAAVLLLRKKHDPDRHSQQLGYIAACEQIIAYLSYETSVDCPRAYSREAIWGMHYALSHAATLVAKESGGHSAWAARRSRAYEIESILRELINALPAPEYMQGRGLREGELLRRARRILDVP